MEHSPLQRRLRALGITQERFGRALGLSENSVSAGLRGTWKTGTPAYLVAVLDALEVMTEEQREEWLKRRERG